MRKKIGWGILGTGRIAGVLAKAIGQSETGELVAVGSRTQESADRFGKEYNVAGRYASYEGVLTDPRVQAVYMSLPNHLHAEWGIRCAQAGKAILLEKPFTTNHPQAMAVIDAARHHNVFLMEAFMYRCHPQTARLVQLLRERAIGDVRIIQANFSYNMGEKLENIRLQNEAAGGAIMDVGCYTLSMARLIAGAAQGQEFAEPIELKGTAHIGPRSRVDEYATAALRFPGDILANLACGSQVNVESAVRIWGSEGNIVVPNPWFPGREKGAGRILVHRAGQEKPEEITIESDRELYTVEVDIVAENLARPEAPPPCMTWADSLGNMKGLDRWRAEVGLKFDAEQPEALKVPWSGRALAPRANHKMKYGRVQGIDKPLSRIVMGTMVVHSSNLPYSYTLLDNFFEIGGTTLDTAHVYGGGKSETAVGQWIRDRGVRDKIVLIAKGAATVEATPEILTRELMITLDRFGLEHVDLYMMHRDNPNVPAGEFVDCLNEHRDAGRMSAFGGSNWTPQRLQEANDYATAKGVTAFAASSPNLSLAEWNEPMWADCVTASDAASRKWYRENGMAVFAWSSQANGIFTGKVNLADKDNPALSEVVRVWSNEGNFQRIERVKELAEKKKVSTTQIALAYVLCQPLNIFALIGPQTLDETRTSVDALDVELSEDERRWLNLEAP